MKCGATIKINLIKFGFGGQLIIPMERQLLFGSVGVLKVTILLCKNF
jgi:hypothetical protein